jgi:hypothetical protein
VHDALGVPRLEGPHDGHRSPSVDYEIEVAGSRVNIRVHRDGNAAKILKRHAVAEKVCDAIVELAA